MRTFPRVPLYAWRWLQRSRPVVTEASRRLTGSPEPSPEFVKDLQRTFEEDAFVRDVLIDVVAEVAFGGRVPRRRPAGASWDRGLIWWAAALAGTTPEDFEGRTSASQDQRPLFDPGPRSEVAPAGRRRPAGPRPSGERLAVARALRSLLDAADGEHVPASAIRQLIDDLEAGGG